MANWFVGFPVSAGDGFDALSPPPVGTRLLAPVDLHLTLAFLGPVEPARARAGFESIPRDAIETIEIGLGRIVPMGHPKRFSALAALVEILSPDAPARVEALTVARDRVLDAVGLPRNGRAMKLHVTLARLGRRASREERDRALAWAASEARVGKRLRLERIALYRAHGSGADRSRGSARGRCAHAYEIIECRDLATRSTRDRREPIHPIGRGDRSVR